MLLHDLLIKHTGGLAGIRDKNLLESAAHAPFATYDGKNLYPSIETKAARLGFGLVKNHPFVDGNKRIGILAMVTFPELNGINIMYTDDELIKLGLLLAEGKLSEKELLHWVVEHN